MSNKYWKEFIYDIQYPNGVSRDINGFVFKKYWKAARERAIKIKTL